MKCKKGGYLNNVGDTKSTSCDESCQFICVRQRTPIDCILAARWAVTFNTAHPMCGAPRVRLSMCAYVPQLFCIECRPISGAARHLDDGPQTRNKQAARERRQTPLRKRLVWFYVCASNFANASADAQPETWSANRPKHIGIGLDPPWCRYSISLKF